MEFFSLHWFQVKLEKVFEKDFNNKNLLKFCITISDTTDYFQRLKHKADASFYFSLASICDFPMFCSLRWQKGSEPPQQLCLITKLGAELFYFLAFYLKCFQVKVELIPQLSSYTLLRSSSDKVRKQQMH